MSYAYLFKYIILGDAGVGKSSLLMQFTERRSQSEMEPTIGVEFGARTVVIDREQIKLQIWDTCGAEMFRAIVRSYYRESAGVLLVYDVTRRESFDNISMWLEEVKKHNHGNLTAILVGNKCDRGSERQVSAEEAQAYAEQQGIMFIETSASTANNVDAAFTVSAKRIYSKIQRSELDVNDQENGVKIGVGAQPPKSDHVKIATANQRNADEDDDSSCC